MPLDSNSADPDEWLSISDVGYGRSDLGGHFHIPGSPIDPWARWAGLIRAILPRFREASSGLIINISSGGGLIGLPATSIYLSTKFALEGLSESLWYELDALGVGLKVVEPGGVETPFHARVARQREGQDVPAEYTPFLSKLGERFANLGWTRSQAEEIAEVIWTAATDGTRRMRYFHGPGIQHLIDSRRQMSDQDYETYLRREFGSDA